jgi:hypothetical protein
MGPWSLDRSRRCDTRKVRVDHLRLRLRLLLLLLRQPRNSDPGLLAGSSRRMSGACPKTCLCRKSSAQSFGMGGDTLPSGRRTRESRYWKGSLGLLRCLQMGIISGLINSGGRLGRLGAVKSETHPRTSRLRVSDLTLGTGVVGGHGGSRPTTTGRDGNRRGLESSASQRVVGLFPLVPWYPDPLVLPVQSLVDPGEAEA